jgi:hypothetical protein
MLRFVLMARGKSVGRIEWRVNGISAAVAAKPAGGGLRGKWRSIPVKTS